MVAEFSAIVRRYVPKNGKSSNNHQESHKTYDFHLTLS